MFFKSTTTFSWNDFLNKALIAFGVSKNPLDTLWTKPTTASQASASGKSLIPLTEELFKRQYVPGEKCDLLLAKIMANLEHVMSWDQISKSFGLESENQSKRISLLDLCAETLIDATQLTLFDPVLYRLDPEMTKCMLIFTDELWKLMNPARGIDSRLVRSLRDQYIRAFVKYIQLPKEQRSQESWLVTTLISEYQAFNIDEHDSAAMLIMVYWT